AYALGSPGGSNIIPYVAKTIIALIDWDMDIQQAINLPHLTNRFGTYDLEENTEAVGMAEDLKRSEERRVGKEGRARWTQYQAEDGIRDFHVTGVQTCALPICLCPRVTRWQQHHSLRRENYHRPDRLGYGYPTSHQPAAPHQSLWHLRPRGEYRGRGHGRGPEGFGL